ncbi:MAG: hypothetical protein CK429_25080 [Mycobacterium sp.]|nr:MAG: hypothetical protein CK429_25080 [Mycobacterium sp.]
MVSEDGREQIYETTGGGCAGLGCGFLGVVPKHSGFQVVELGVHAGDVLVWSPDVLLVRQLLHEAGGEVQGLGNGGQVRTQQG